jgi:hypothetical protein
MNGSIELLLSFSSFIVHNSSFSFTYPLAAGGINLMFPTVEHFFAVFQEG